MRAKQMSEYPNLHVSHCMEASSVTLSLTDRNILRNTSLLAPCAAGTGPVLSMYYDGCNLGQNTRVGLDIFKAKSSLQCKLKVFICAAANTHRPRRGIKAFSTNGYGGVQTRAWKLKMLSGGSVVSATYALLVQQQLV